mgnify:CR=1 FL=1
MSTLTLKSSIIFHYINNVKSERIGFYISFIFHFIILLFAIGLPNFFDRAEISVPNIIPVEIINVKDITSIPKKIENNNKEKISKKITETKKFSSSETKEIEKIEIKQKPKVEKKGDF